MSKVWTLGRGPSAPDVHRLNMRKTIALLPLTNAQLVQGHMALPTRTALSERGGVPLQKFVPSYSKPELQGGYDEC